MQAYACGLREASKELNGGHVYASWIASKLHTTDSTGKAGRGACFGASASLRRPARLPEREAHLRPKRLHA